MNKPEETSIARSIVVLATSRLFINITRRFYYPFLPEIQRDLGVSLAAVQGAAASQAGVGIFSPVLGTLSDRFGRKRMMMAASLLITLASLPGVLFPNSFSVFYAVMVAWGFLKWLFDPAMQAYVSERVPYSGRGRAIGITELAWAGALMLGAPLAGFLLGVASLQAVYVMIMALNLLGLAITALLVPDDFAEQSQATRRTLRLADVVGMLRHPIAGAALLFSVALYAANEMLFIVYGDWMEQTFDLELAQLGLFTVSIAVAEVIGESAVVLYSDKIGKRRMVLVGTLVSSLGYFVLPVLGFSLVAAMIGLFVIFIAVEIAIVSAIPIFTEVLPQSRALMMSSNVAAQATGRFGGAFLGASLYSAMGFGVVGGVAMGIGLLALLIMMGLIQENTESVV